MNQQMNEKQLETLQTLANGYAIRVSNKLPYHAKGLWGVEDLQSELIVEVCKYWDKYDPEKALEPFLHTILRNHSTSLVTKIWDKKQLQESSGIDPEVEVVREFEEEEPVAVLADPLTVEGVIEQEEAEKIMARQFEVEKRRIEQCCYKFDVPYDEEKLMHSLIRVCDKTLNHMSEEEFQKLSYEEQMWLAKCGQAIKNSGLRIVETSGKLQSKGLVGAVRAIVEASVNDPNDPDNRKADPAEIRKALDKRGMIYKDGSISVVIYEERSRYGLPRITKRRDEFKKIVRELYDNGRGVLTTGGMAEALKDRNVEYKPGPLRELMSKLKKETREANE